MFDFLTNDVLCITANFGHFGHFYLNHLSALEGYFIKWVLSENQSFLDERVTINPYQFSFRGQEGP